MPAVEPLAEDVFDSDVPPPERRQQGANVPPTVAKKLQDAYLRHRHFVLMAENSVIKDLLEPYERARNELIETIRRLAEQDGATSDLSQMLQQRRRQLRARIDEILRIAESDTIGTARERLKQFMEKEHQVQANILRREIPNKIGLDLVGPDADRAAHIIESPLGGKRWSDRMADNYGQLRKALKRDLAVSIIEGEGMEAAARRITGNVKKIGKNRATVLARSEIQRVANQTSTRLYQRNSDVIKSMEWVATLDHRTCPVCASKAGRTWRVEKPPGNPPPIHAQCRCVLTPITRTFEEMGIDAPETGGATMRASQDGPVGSMNYREWFRQQSDSFQRRVLGPSRFKAYKAGKIDFDSMVKNNRVVRVGDLPEASLGGGAAAAANRSGAGPTPIGAVNEIDPAEARKAKELVSGMETDHLALADQIKDHSGLGSLSDDLLNPVERDKVRKLVRQEVGEVDLGAVRGWKNGRRSFDEAVRITRNQHGDEVAEALRTQAARRSSRSLTNAWGATSADSNKWSVAVQRAARDEFGLTDAPFQHIESRLDDSALSAVDDVTSNHGDILKRHLRAQYDRTQDVLREAGLDHVTLYRGSTFDEAPDWLNQASGPITADNLDEVGGQVVHSLQPLSSTSSDFTVAWNFSGTGPGDEVGVINAMRVPREQVLGLPGTGFGHTLESEYVLLGGRYEMFSVKREDWTEAITGAELTGRQGDQLKQLIDAHDF